MQMNDRAVRLLKPQASLQMKKSCHEAPQCPRSSRLLQQLAFQKTEENHKDCRSLISTWLILKGVLQMLSIKLAQNTDIQYCGT